MNVKFLFVIVFCFVVVVLVLVLYQCGEVEVFVLFKVEVDGIIFECQQIMFQFDKDVKQFGEIVVGIQLFDKLVEVICLIVNGVKDLKVVFEVEVFGGCFKFEVWSNWVDYLVWMDKFVQNVEQMVKFGQEGNFIVVIGLFVDVLLCKECYDVYWVLKKFVVLLVG